ncbi:UDP-2,4-diacetamido-2,4,6-trideoxy-beta-L-altropyranose hydrolase [Clostridium sp. BJN0001]|uniref:UDP-2,4-diacetamido-2,4, 6-trideoxy-beta-L-altropyranose hydrolase n=1 Tax=Clostridium sp. BJN0001 TaxID=2930219 RepID=UPI001FD0A885|nr:UDP-2,4-diacetamido-2,4,6-trideoxy-beta-L-altropyranose hydrolase [Clostridium sp. BJN0001]
MKIFIRTDGGREIGLGHIMRMLVLADELRKSNEVIFICRNSKNNKFEAGIEKIYQNDFKILFIKEKDYINDIISLQKEYKADLLITDSYDVSESYFNVLKPYFRFTGYVDDVNKMKMNVDFIINQNINAKELDYSSNINLETKLFLGPKYCMIRKEFKEAFKLKVVKDEVSDIMLTLGGMDDDNNTGKILKMIKDINKNIHVVIGSAFSEETIKSIENLSIGHENIYLYKNANMADIMRKCDVAISSCGSTIYELCSMNVIPIGIIVAENQRKTAEFMKSNELIAKIFNAQNLNSHDLINFLNNLLNNKSKRLKIFNNQKNIVNINGAKLLVDKINKIKLK